MMVTTMTAAFSMARAIAPASEPRSAHGGPSRADLVVLLDRGGVLAIPSESSYGLGADPTSARGVAAIYRIKGRPPVKALPVVAADLAQLAALGVDIEAPIVRWAGAHWPAALTVVAPRRADAPPLPAAADTDTLAVRIPAHDGLRRLLRALGRPLTATSANRAGADPILRPAALEPLLRGHDAAIIDHGTLPGGVPSTLVTWGDGGLRVLRAGAFELADPLLTTNDPTSSPQQE